MLTRKQPNQWNLRGYVSFTASRALVTTTDGHKEATPVCPKSLFQLLGIWTALQFMEWTYYISIKQMEVTYVMRNSEIRCLCFNAVFHTVVFLHPSSIISHGPRQLLLQNLQWLDSTSLFSGEAPASLFSYWLKKEVQLTETINYFTKSK